jgi:hypothetical protein
MHCLAIRRLCIGRAAAGARQVSRMQGLDCLYSRLCLLQIINKCWQQPRLSVSPTSPSNCIPYPPNGFHMTGCCQKQKARTASGRRLIGCNLVDI